MLDSARHSYKEKGEGLDEKSFVAGYVASQEDMYLFKPVPDEDGGKD